MTFWGFGTASERLNKRVRDSAFSALLRQEVGFFDKRSVGSITSELQDDAAKIHAFSGEPVRSFIIAIASLLTGLALSFAVSIERFVSILWLQCLTISFVNTVHVAICSRCDWLRPSHGICDCDSHEGHVRNG